MLMTVVKAVCAAVFVINVNAAMLTVPDEYDTVQDALNASASGDTVLINSGNYVQELSVPNHDITIASQYLFSNDTLHIEECVLRPPPHSVGRTLLAATDEPQPILRLVGLYIKGSSSGLPVTGGGIAAHNREIEIRACYVDSCHATIGGGLFARNCNVSIASTRFLHTGSNEFGNVAYFENCVSIVDSVCAQSCFSTNNDPSAVAFFVERGSLSLRSSIVQDFGWEDVPGGYCIRQVGVADYLEIVGCEIRNNRFHHFFRLPGEGVLQWSNIRFDSNYVVSNEFQHDLFQSAGADTGSISLFRYNVFSGNRRLSEPGWLSRMLFSAADSVQIIEISHNLFCDNESEENSVALILGPTTPFHIKFNNNYIFRNSCDGFANPPGGVLMTIACPANVIFRNVIAESNGYAAFQGLLSSPPSFLPFNYWGDSSGPYHAIENESGLGDSVEYLVSVTPWYSDSSFNEQNIRVRSAQPSSFVLGFPYPNPFNSSVTIEYAVTREQAIRLVVYDILGRRVETLLDERQGVGVHNILWNAEGMASGVYFARLSSGNLAQTVKLLLMK